MPRTGMTAEELKDKAVETAIGQVRKHGFEKLRLVDVAKELGVSHAALYPYFTDKAALLDAVSERWLVSIDESLAEICAAQGDPEQKIRDWIVGLHRAKLDKVRADPSVYKAFNSAADQNRPFTKTHLKNSHEQMVGLCREWISRYGSEGADPEKMATLLQSATLSFHIPGLVAKHMNEDREPLLNDIVETILRGLKA